MSFGPDAGNYNVVKPFGQSKGYGGAPNNFLLMSTDKYVAPFGSTAKKGFVQS
jgi:hypothetical protein